MLLHPFLTHCNMHLYTYTKKKTSDVHRREERLFNEGRGEESYVYTCCALHI